MTRKLKLTVLTWVAIFPYVSILLFAIEPFIGGAPMILRTLVMTVLLVPLMVFVLMPTLMSKFHHWLED